VFNIDSFARDAVRDRKTRTVATTEKEKYNGKDRETFYNHDQLCAGFVRKKSSALNKSSRDVFGLTWIGLQVL